MRSPHLAEEHQFQPVPDEFLASHDDYAVDDTDWADDPMVILIRKQELERLELEYLLQNKH